MAKCNIAIKAANGESSLLFKDIVAHSNNPETAIDEYFYTKTAEFKDMFGDWEAEGFDKSKLDKNGEPKYSALAEGAYMHDKDFSEIDLGIQSEAFKRLNEVVPGMIRKIEESIESLAKKKNKKTGDKSFIKKLADIADELKEGNLAESVPAFLHSSTKHVERLELRMNKEAAEKDFDIHYLASLNRIAKGYTVIADLQNALAGYEDAGIFADDIFKPSAAVLGHIQNIENIYIRKSKDFLVSAFHAHNSSWTKQDIKSWLDESPRDLKWTERMLEYAGDSKDRLIASTADVVKQSENMKRLEAIKFNDELEVVQEALEKEAGNVSPQKMYEDILVETDYGLKVIPIAVEEGSAQQQYLDKLRQSKPALYNFLLFYHENMGKTSSMVGADMGGRVPTVLQSEWEMAKGKSVKDKYNVFADSVKRSIIRTNLDMERGAVLDASGRPLDRIPIFYTQAYDSELKTKRFNEKFKELMDSGMGELEATEAAEEYAVQVSSKEMSKLVSRDLAGSLQAFHAMATNYAQKEAILDIVESAQAVAGSEQRKYTLIDTAGRAVKDKATGDFVKITGKEAKAPEYLKNFLQMHVYGQTQKDLGYIDIAGQKIDTNKALRQLNKKTSWIQMSLNMLASIANVGNGEYNNFMESVSGEYYKVKNYKKASRIYRENLSGIIGDIGARTPKSLVGNLIEHYDMVQDFNPRGSIQAAENNSAKRLLKTSLAFFMQNAGEHFMQSRTAMAILDNTMAYDKSGKEVGSLLDQHSVVDGKLKIENVYIKNDAGELVKYNERQQGLLTNRMNAIGRKMYGNYNQHTATAMKQDARTALILKYRDWAYEGIVRRYGKKQYYSQQGQDIEGFYITSARFFFQAAKDLKGFQLQLVKENWSKLSSHEKANIRRAVTEASFITAMGIMSALAAYAGKAAEEEFSDDSFSSRASLGAISLLAYEANRLTTEIFAYLNPVEALRLMKTPAASTSILENTVKLINQLVTDPFATYDAGWRKGDSKLGARAEKLIPIYKQLKTLNPDGIKDRGIIYEL